MARLAALEVNEVLLECGARLAGAFVKKGLVDEMVLYVAPSLMGEMAAPLLNLGVDAQQVGAAPLPTFEFIDTRCVGDDVRLVLTARKH
jgi:diaminohydroxyphosphoribosylaminopyrimidine deaminase/5-amino-6-(5-phosphoribosylamino)uracil reductase